MSHSSIFISAFFGSILGTTITILGYLYIASPKTNSANPVAFEMSSGGVSSSISSVESKYVYADIGSNNFSDSNLVSLGASNGVPKPNNTFFFKCADFIVATYEKTFNILNSFFQDSTFTNYIIVLSLFATLAVISSLLVNFVQPARAYVFPFYWLSQSAKQFIFKCFLLFKAIDFCNSPASIGFKFNISFDDFDWKSISYYTFQVQRKRTKLIQTWPIKVKAFFFYHKVGLMHFRGFNSGANVVSRNSYNFKNTWLEKDFSVACSSSSNPSTSSWKAAPNGQVAKTVKKLVTIQHNPNTDTQAVKKLFSVILRQHTRA